MAFADFYMQTTGSDTNAGSTTDDAAPFGPSTNGNWDTASANRFVAAGGATPFLGVTTGMYASIYVDGAGNTGFVSKITAVDVGGTYIEVSKTANKIGSAPSAAATGRTCKVGGAWASTLMVSTLFNTIQTLDQATRVNVKAGTYSNVSSRTCNTSGTATLPLWWRGYNASPGDLDDYSSLTKPLWSCTSNGRYSFAGAFNIISGLDITAAVANPTVSISGTDTKIHRCRLTNTTANALSCALSIAATRFLCSCSYLTATSTATYIADCTNATANFIFFGNFLTGGGTGIGNVATAADLTVCRCVFQSLGAGAVKTAQTTGSCRIIENTMYGLGAAGVEFTGVYAGNGLVINNNLWSITGYGLNASGGTTCTVFRAGNTFRSCSSGDENGFGDSPGAPGASGATWGSQDETVDVWLSTTNMTPRIYSKAHQMALPRTFEYQPYNTYADVGAVNSQNAPAPTVGGHVVRRI